MNPSYSDRENPNTTKFVKKKKNKNDNNNSNNSNKTREMANKQTQENLRASEFLDNFSACCALFPRGIFFFVANLDLTPF